jgi:hypothetical protein
MSDPFRDRPRMLVRRPGAWIPAGAAAQTTEIVDLSLTGARIRVTESAKAGREGELVLALIPELPPLRLKGRVVWESQGLQGIEFLPLEGRTMKVLRSLVEFHLDSGLSSAP